MEVLNEGCSLCVLVPAAMVSCSSSAYRFLCNCYYFFLSLTLLFYSPPRDFSILHAYVPVNVFNFSRLRSREREVRETSSRLRRLLTPLLEVNVRSRLCVHVHVFNFSHLLFACRFFSTSTFTSSILHVVRGTLDVGLEN